MVSMANVSMVPWIEWSYCPCHDPTGATPDPMVLNPARPPRVSNVGRFAQGILVEPFPHLIAGTPISWSYDRRKKSFRLRYSTAKARGRGRFAAGAITEISTPRFICGRPSAVHVRGGAIVSPPGSPILQIAACGGARKISVQVLPSGRSRQSCTR
jgi:endoglycosylceramidase